MSNFSRLFLMLTLGFLVFFPAVGSRKGWLLGSERNLNIMAQSEDCAPEFRNSQGQCLRTSRSVGSRRSFFGGSYGHGK